MFKIATTETYDPTLCIDEWVNRDKEFDFLLYITKILNPRITTLLTGKESPWAWMNKPSVLHLTITGWGDTDLEPNVIDCDSMFQRMYNLVQLGYPIERMVLRIDPIIPTENGIWTFDAIVRKGQAYGFTRFRSSIMQLYKHSSERLKHTGEWSEIARIYHGNFFPPESELKRICFFDVIQQTIDVAKKVNPNVQFECCASPMLQQAGFEACGCMSERDLIINELNPDELNIPKGNQRTNCMCLLKHQLIPGGYKRGRCPHRCAYCYLKDVEPKLVISTGDALY